jgi:protein-L-isoaspartate(D-aspartate) O-methyltransferase
MQSNEGFANLRKRMVDEQLIAQGISNKELLEAFLTIPRHLFVDPSIAHNAYCGYPLPIGYGQTISSPYIIALMIENLLPLKSDRILEIGTGSGYQTAILARLAKTVYTIECIPELLSHAQMRLIQLGIINVRYKVADGSMGWQEFAPYDKIIVSACGEHIPYSLIEQLKENGRLVIPIKRESSQILILGVKHRNRLIQRKIRECRFVPLIDNNRLNWG